MDRLKQLREPATVVALVGLALDFALTLLSFLLTRTSDELLPVYFALRLGDPVLVAVLAALVVTCSIAEPTPRARVLAALSLVLTGGQLATAVGLLLAGLLRLPAARVELMGMVPGAIPWLTTAVIAIAVFVSLLHRPSVAAAPAATEVVEPPQVSAPGPADPQLQPGWSPDAAVGAVGRRAGDAAAGAPATSWDDTPETAGWGQIPTADGPPQASSQQS